METARARYSGPSRKLVVALDIGTTFSGAAYTFLDPGKVPYIQPVTSYPKALGVGSGKVPSILYYDRNGNFCGVENGVDFQDDDAFLKVKWWKLMLSPAELSAEMKDQMPTRLPRGKTIIDIFADFMRYLFDSTKALFMATEPYGESRWKSVSNKIELVLSHPNGWGGLQQTQLRTAVARAGIVPDSRVHFVTEGEASFNFCATHTQAGKNLKRGEQVLIIDAGGGTIDISTYTVLNNAPLRVEETHEPKCLPHGGEFITTRARAAIQKRLKGSKFGSSEGLTLFAQKFDEGVKRVFSDDQVPQSVKFGSPWDNDSNAGIRAGGLTLTGAQISGFFEPSIQSIVDSVEDNLNRWFAPYTFAFLVGGFAASPWLSRQLEKRLSDIGLKICKPDTHTNKAVAVGGVSYYVDKFVTGRISKFTYGVACNVAYRFYFLEHRRREHMSILNPAGEKRLPHYFETMLSRGAKVLKDHEVRHSFCYVTEGAPQRQALQTILKYTGTDSVHRWTDIEPDKFEMLCNIRADISAAPYQTETRSGGKPYYTRNFDVILLVGLTELKAQIAWIDAVTGAEKSFESNAAVVYDSPSEET